MSKVVPPILSLLSGPNSDDNLVPETAQIHKSDRQVQQNVSVMGSEACQRSHITAGINFTVLKEETKKKNDSWVSGMSNKVDEVGIY